MKSQIVGFDIRFTADSRMPIASVHRRYYIDSGKRDFTWIQKVKRYKKLTWSTCFRLEALFDHPPDSIRRRTEIASDGVFISLQYINLDSILRAQYYEHQEDLERKIIENPGQDRLDFVEF